MRLKTRTKKKKGASRTGHQHSCVDHEKGYRIKFIRDGAGDSQGIQPGWLTGKKKWSTERCDNTNLLLWLHSCNLNKLKGCYWVPALLMSVGQAEREHTL